MKNLVTPSPVLGLVLFTCSCILMACQSGAPEDACCTSSVIPQGEDIKEGQGLLQVKGISDAYYYILDPNGTQVAYQTLNKSIALDPGTYKIKVNNTHHPVEIAAGSMMTCETAALKVSGKTGEYYYVLDTLGQQVTYETLEKGLALFPGSFLVRLNNTTLPVTVPLGAPREVKSGTLLVQGTTGEYYYVTDENGTQLGYNTLGKPLGVLAGNYRIKLNNTVTRAAVREAEVTEVEAGTILIKGLTDEYYYALDSVNNQLSYQTINKPLAMLPGRIKLRVNNTETTAEVKKGQTTEFTTGSLEVTGPGSDYYYVLDASGNQLGYNSINKSLSFVPGEYTIRLGEKRKNLMVRSGEKTSVAVTGF